MYLCQKCGAEFIDPLGGRCPACGARAKRSWRLEAARPAPEPPAESPSRPAQPDTPPSVTSDSVSSPHRPSTVASGTQPSVDRFPDSGVYGPPTDYGVPTKPVGTGRGGRGAFRAVLIMIALFSIVGFVVFLLVAENVVDDVIDSVTDEFRDITGTAEDLLWRDRAAEMREAGYAPVAGLPADLWPVADRTIWFVGDGDWIYYEAVRDKEARTLSLPDGVTSVGDLYPTPDGTGVVAVLTTALGPGVYHLSVGGESELLLDGDRLRSLILAEDFFKPANRVGLEAAFNSGAFIRQPRLDEEMETLFVAAGAPGEYKIWVTDLASGEVEILESYSINMIPCVVRDGVLYYQHASEGPGDPALVYARDLDSGDHEFFMTPGNSGGIISFDIDEEGFAVYLAVDYQGEPIVGFQRPGETLREDLALSGYQPKSAAAGPGGVIVTTGAYEGKDHFFFFNVDNLEGEDMPHDRSWTGVDEIRSACLGPPLAE